MPACAPCTSAWQPSPAALQRAKAGGAGGSCNLTIPDYLRRALKSGAGLLWLQLLEIGLPSRSSERGNACRDSSARLRRLRRGSLPSPPRSERRLVGERGLAPPRLTDSRS